MGQPHDQMVVASSLVGALFRCPCCIIVDSDATEMDATSWHLAQHRPVSTVLTCRFAGSSRSPSRRTRAAIPYRAALTQTTECCIRCNSAPLEAGGEGVPAAVGPQAGDASV